MRWGPRLGIAWLEFPRTFGSVVIDNLELRGPDPTIKTNTISVLANAVRPFGHT